MIKKTMGHDTVSIGGLSVHLCVDRHIEWAYPDTHKEFRKMSSLVDCRVEVGLMNGKPNPCNKPCSGRRWCFQHRDSSENKILSVWKCSEDGNLEAILDHQLGASVATMRVRPGKVGGNYPLIEPFEQLLWMNLLASRGGIIVHACSAVMNGKAFLFPGESGCGKSTIASLLKRYSEAIVLSDELTIIRSVGRELRVFGTPWPSRSGCVSSLEAPLYAVLFPEHGARNTLVKLSDGFATALLYACACRPVWLGYMGIEQFQASMQLPRWEYVARFSFLPDISAVDYLKAKFT